VAAIRLYRIAARAVPRRRPCLYALSCSRHIEQVALAKGVGNALMAMTRRFAACRPGYAFEFWDNDWRLACVNGSYIPSVEVSRAIHAEADLIRNVTATSATARASLDARLPGTRD